MVGSHRVACWLAAIPLLLATGSASAIVTVGPAGGGCTYTSINAAINYVLGKERNAPNDVDPYIAVAGGYVYNEPLVIDSTGVTSYTNPYGRQAAFVQIYGNYDGNCDDIPDGSTAYVDTGGSKVNHSVLEIKGSSPVDVVLNHFVLAEAYGSVATGGGINFHGSGLLDLSNVEITNNNAGYGGGIFADGHAPGISITLHSGIWIHGNSASHGGGGINIQGETRLFALEGQTLIEYNAANNADSVGAGGGLRVTGSQALADIGSPGYNGAPVISNNNARYGGGISIEDSGTVRLFSTFASLPARIEYNTATSYGGGVSLNGSANPDHLCGDGYSISHNSAPSGAAIYAVDSLIDLTAQGIQCNTAAFLPDRAPCTPGMASCNTINGNLGVGDGSDVISLLRTDFPAERVELNGNAGAHLIAAGFGTVSLTNCMIANNTTTQILLDAAAGAAANLSVASCTLTNNTVPIPNGLFDVAGDALFLRSSIVWQPGLSTLGFNSAGQAHFTDLIAYDADTLNSQSGAFAEFDNVHSYGPRFVDAANGDFHLQPDSPAIDYALSGPAFDLTGNPRAIALWYPGAPYDVGAYEVQSPGDVIFVNAFGR